LAEGFLIIAHNYFNINLVYWRDKICRNFFGKDEHFIALLNLKKKLFPFYFKFQKKKEKFS